LKIVGENKNCCIYNVADSFDEGEQLDGIHGQSW